MHPFAESDTVSTGALVAMGLVMPLFLLVGYEFIVLKRRKEDMNVLAVSVLFFLSGWFATLVVTDVVKLMAGRLRPDFIARCEPDYTQWNITETPFITGDICTGDIEEIREGRLSFPSGHSSMSAYGLLYMAMELQFVSGAMLPLVFGIARPVMQLSLLSLTLYISIGRLQDYRHHPEDVAAGVALGALMAYWTVRALRSIYVPHNLCQKPQGSLSQRLQNEDTIP